MKSYLSISNKTGSVGVIVATMGCASCFPAIATLGASIGLGFLSQYEGFFLSTLLPIFAGIALIINGAAYLSHKIWYRSVIGMVGPTLVLLSVYWLWVYDWNQYVMYTGIALMLSVSIWDIVSPAQKVCSSCATDEECHV